MNTPTDRLLINYSNARRSWESWGFMMNWNLEKPKPEVVEYILKNELLSHLRYLAFKDFHIEMYKIIKDSSRNSDNIFSLLKKRQTQDTSKYEIIDKNIGELIKNTTAINLICDTRDKFYAHLDKNHESYNGIRLSVPMALNCFIAVENAIMTLTSREILQSHLDNIPSRDDLHL